MKIKLKELQPNPFKKYIFGGKLDKKRIQIIEESIEHGTLPEHFVVRKIKGKFELTSGHHRVEALKKIKGKNYAVDVSIRNFSDEQMMIDMVRENITQRDTDYHDKEAGIVLVREWLRTGVNRVNQFDTARKQNRDRKGKYQEVDDSYRNIAKFLSKNGKAVSHETVYQYLKVHDNLNKEIHSQIGSDLSFKDALSLSRIPDKKEQAIIKERLDSSNLTNRDNRLKAVTQYLNAPDEIRKKIKDGEIDLEDIKIEGLKYKYLINNKPIEGKSASEWINELDDSLRRAGKLMDLRMLDICSKGQVELLYRYLKIEFDGNYKPFFEKIGKRITTQEVEHK